MNRLAFIFLIGGLGLSAKASTNNCVKFQYAVKSGSDSSKLKQFLDVQWKYFMTEFPEWATYVGYPGQDDRWTDESLSAIKRRKAEVACQREALLKVARQKLKRQEQINFDLSLRALDMSLEGQKFKIDFMPINHLNGFQIDTIHLFNAMPARTVPHYEAMLKRLEKFPQVVADTEALMREGIKHKAMLVKVFMPKITAQLEALTPKSPEESPLFLPFKKMSPSIPAEESQRIASRAKEILQEKVYPALTSFKTFFVTEYAPQGREVLAWAAMPDGKKWYEYAVKRHTTANLDPNEIHEIGLREVNRITAEMEKIKVDVKFKGDLKAFNRFLLKDKQFKFKDADALLNGYRDIAKRIDAELPKYFKTLPRLPYGVRAMPEFQAKSAPAAHYIRGSLENGRAGWFEANTNDLNSRTRWDMETLTMHEAVPGHHLQIALASEQTGLPEFRKFESYTAFVEGWALYAESLGREMGFFKDPYSLYGHLSAEMMRAVRLVVDTGLHAKGWSKEKALDFYRSKMPISDSDSEIEIDRYITWPAQALAYKMGQMKIRELREASATKLGPAFDVREFHDQVLKNGALPLDVLEKNIVAWQKAVGNAQAIPRQ